jgi:hypothetical protein
MQKAFTYTHLKYVQDGFLFFIALATIALFILTHFSIAAAGTMDVAFGKDDLSATIEQSSLKAVIEKIAEKKDIWVKAREYMDEIRKLNR